MLHVSSNHPKLCRDVKEICAPAICVEEETMLLMATCLHDLCQPLTAVQCRLEIGLLDGSRAGITNAVREALTECARLNDYVRTMQMSVVERQRVIRGQL